MYKKPDFEPTREEMIEILKNNISKLTKKEVIPLDKARGRICGKDIYASYSLPNKKVSNCDGISILFENSEVPDTSKWIEGKEYMFSNTGVAIEDRYDTVIPIEEVIINADSSIKLSATSIKAGNHVGKIGRYIKRKELLASKGDVITPTLMGILSSAGIKNIKVIVKPKVTFIPTGDELVPVGYPLPEGKNVESNSIMIKAEIEECGGEVIVTSIIPDKKSKIEKALTSAIKSSDLVLISGGSSKGRKDYTLDVLEKLGVIMVRELGHGPGKHMSLTITKKDIPVIGLPGPPNGVDLITNLYVKNIIRLMNGKPIKTPDMIEAILTEDIDAFGFDFFRYFNVFMEDGKYYAESLVMNVSTRAELYRSHNARFCARKGVAYKKGDLISLELGIGREYIREV